MARATTKNHSVIKRWMKKKSIFYCVFFCCYAIYKDTQTEQRMSMKKKVKLGAVPNTHNTWRISFHGCTSITKIYTFRQYIVHQHPRHTQTAHRCLSSSSSSMNSRYTYSRSRGRRTRSSTYSGKFKHQPNISITGCRGFIRKSWRQNFRLFSYITFFYLLSYFFFYSLFYIIFY